ncbi:5864_t:CDS:2 [Rhizophagus irregularis]|nr:5864_t:CDS:2 [Rhizophagus irregularis]
MEFVIPEEITALPKLTKVAAKMLSSDEDNDWDSPLKLKVQR